MFATKNEKDTRDEGEENIKSIPSQVLLIVAGLYRTCSINVAFIYSASMCSVYLHIGDVHLFSICIYDVVSNGVDS